MNTLNLQIEFFSYWQCGTGRGDGVDLDGVVSRDDDGLPHVPGKTFKGILKDALFRYLTLSADADAEAEATIEEIFGEGTNEKKEESKNYRINSAHLPAADRAAISKNENDLKAYLYKSIQSTEIDPTTGGAKTGALRSNEVAIPLTLETQIVYIGKAEVDHAKHFEIFESALPFFYIGIGGGRRRGFGRVKVTVQNNTETQNAA